MFCTLNDKAVISKTAMMTEISPVVALDVTADESRTVTLLAAPENANSPNR